jgi:(p)ppGpp synthase/HD superfamily hydrolase
VSRVAKAAAYAARVHDGQTRTGTQAPKMAHLLGVTANVLEDAGRRGAVDEDEAVAALLHDAAEDGGGRERLEDIRLRFGDRVAEIVEALSDGLEPEPERPRWRDRKDAYLRSLRQEERPSVLRVSLADKLDNMRAIVAAYRTQGDAFWDRFHPREDTLWYYGALAQIFSAKLPGPMAEELATSVALLRAEA